MVSEYVLRLRLDITGKWLEGSSRITIAGRIEELVTKLRFILNRGLKPVNVRGRHVGRWKWYRRSLDDLENLVVNVIEVELSKSIFSGEGRETELVIGYEGSIRDYSSVFPLC